MILVLLFWNAKIRGYDVVVPSFIWDGRLHWFKFKTSYFIVSLNGNQNLISAPGLAFLILGVHYNL